MYIKRLLKLAQRGDTIVEVLVAIAVISLVMGGAFVMTNRSLQDSRSAQERVNATKLTESQIELLKNLVATNPTAVFGASVPASYCLTGASAVVASTNVACTVDVSGAATIGQPAFHLSISRSGNTFTFLNSWISFRGNVTNNVVMKYRVYQQ
jgi:prepilin-type N-terminal cleavage/methylation domain-containing protein